MEVPVGYPAEQRPPQTDTMNPEFTMTGGKKHLMGLICLKCQYCMLCTLWAKNFNTFEGRITMNRCQKCGFRARYDKNPRSILGRIWKWHIGWCPGWKSYIKSLPDEEQKKLSEQYS